MESLLSILKSHVAQADHELLILLPTSGICYQAWLESSFTLAYQFVSPCVCVSQHMCGG